MHGYQSGNGKSQVQTGETRFHRMPTIVSIIAKLFVNCKYHGSRGSWHRNRGVRVVGRGRNIHVDTRTIDPSTRYTLQQFCYSSSI